MNNNQGWHRHPKEHSLASRGIPTKQTIQTKIDPPDIQRTPIQEVNWDLTKTDYGAFDDSIKNPDNPNRNYDCELRWLTPDEFIELQYQTIARFHSNTNRPMERSPRDSFWSGYSPEHAKRTKDYMTSGKKIPSFVIEIDDEGITSFQEGRHRIIVAKEMGLKEVPVWFCTKIQ